MTDNNTPIGQSLQKQGDFLFRWRSYLPLLLLIPGLIALFESRTLLDSYSDVVEDIAVAVGFAISLFGLAIRWVTVGFVPGGTSGRNTKDQRAHHLNTTGMYSVCRNPLYLGNFVAIMGVLVSVKILWLPVMGALAYWLYIERIIATEEGFLTRTYGDAYTEWAARTPAFIPDFRLWRRADLRFSMRTVLKREYNGLMAVCSAFFVNELLLDVLFHQEPLLQWAYEDWAWLLMFGLATVSFIVLRTLKRKTRLLHVSGR